MMKKISRQLLKLAERAARSDAERISDTESFTPICIGILHQPKRQKR